MAPGNKRIVLDEPRSIYYASQIISGYIEFGLSEPLEYRMITIHHYGKATVHWTETETEEYNGMRREVNINYGDQEEYFNKTEHVHGGNVPIRLEPGIHKIYFTYQIPSTSPSSYTSERGQVKYTMTAFIDYADPNMGREELSAEYEVVAIMDLNTIDEFVRRPLELEIEEFYSCCCSSSPVSITLSLPAAGYCPGQRIPIHVRANNRSPVEIKGIVFQLVKKECFHSSSPKSDYIPPEEVLLREKTKPILSGTSRDFTVDLVVPDMIAPNLENCNIINVGFFLKVRVEVSGCNEDYEDETELYIGLVPISGLDQQYVHPLQSDLPVAPIPKHAPTVIYENDEALGKTDYSKANAGYPNANAGYPNANTGYPNANAGYPNANAGYPNANAGYSNTGYPNTNSPKVTNNIPLAPIAHSNIGFMVPVTPPGVDPFSMGPANAQTSHVPYTNFASPSAPPPS